jgi:hypothetical protein
VASAEPIILAGQKVFSGTPASSLPALVVLRSGTIITNALNVPYTTQMNAGVQRQLPWNSVIDVNVLYTRTTHEFMRDADIANFFAGNGAPIRLGDGSLPSNAISVVTSDGYSRYKAFTANGTNASRSASSTPRPTLSPASTPPRPMVSVRAAAFWSTATSRPTTAPPSSIARIVSP